MALSEWAKQNTMRRQHQLMDAVERPFRRDVFREKNRYIRATSEDYSRTGRFSYQLLEQHQQNISEILRKYHKRIMVFIDHEVYTLAKSYRPNLELKQESRIDFIFRQWFTLFGASRAKEIGQTTQDDIRRVLIASQDQDQEAEVPVIKRILRARGLSAWRSATIARTETHQAAMYASKSTATAIQTETGLQLLKQWIPVQDGRTRDAHAAMDGSKPIAMDAKFFVNGEWIDRPGEGSSANAINCRCVLAYTTD